MWISSRTSLLGAGNAFPSIAMSLEYGPIFMLMCSLMEGGNNHVISH